MEGKHLYKDGLYFREINQKPLFKKITNRPHTMAGTTDFE